MVEQAKEERATEIQTLFNDMAFILEPHQLIRKILSLSKGGWTVELACGSAKIAYALSLFTATPSIAVDYNKERLLYAVRLNRIADELFQIKSNITFLQMDVLKDDVTANLPANFFGVAVSEGFLEHLTDENRDKFMELQLKLLRKDGLLAVIVPNSDDERQRKRSLENHPNYGDEKLYTVDSLREYLEQWNLSDLKVESMELLLIATGRKASFNIRK